MLTHHFSGLAGMRSMRPRPSGVAGPAGPAWEQILNLAQADGWTAAYDPTNPNTRTLRESDGDQFITQIEDGLGNLPALVQETEAEQPQLSLEAFGNLAGAVGNGSTTRLQTPGFTTLSQPWSLVVVARSDNTSASRRLINALHPTSGTSFLRQTDNKWQVGATGSTLDGPAIDTMAHVVSILFNGGSSAIRIDGEQVASGELNDADFDGFEILHSNDQFWEGPFSSYCVRSDVSIADITAMEDLLHDLTGIAKAT